MNLLIVMLFCERVANMQLTLY